MKCEKKKGKWLIMKILEMLKTKLSTIGTICAKYINEENEIEYLPIF